MKKTEPKVPTDNDWWLEECIASREVACRLLGIYCCESIGLTCAEESREAIKKLMDENCWLSERKFRARDKLRKKYEKG